MEGIHQIPEGGHGIHPHLPKHSMSRSWCRGAVRCSIAGKLLRMHVITQGSTFPLHRLALHESDALSKHYVALRMQGCCMGWGPRMACKHSQTTYRQVRVVQAVQSFLEQLHERGAPATAVCKSDVGILLSHPAGLRPHMAGRCVVAWQHVLLQHRLQLCLVWGLQRDGIP